MELTTNAIATTTYTNKNLCKATAKINKLGTQIQRNMFEVAAIVARVNNTKDYEEDGFKNVHEWTAQAFGIKKTVSYNLVRIGSEYVEAITNESGKILSYGSNLYHAGEDDFSIAQVQVMLPAGRAAVAQLAEEEKITPEMTVKQIKEVVKLITEDEEEDEEEPLETEGDTEGGAEGAETEPAETELTLETAYQALVIAVGGVLTAFEDLPMGGTETQHDAMRAVIAAVEKLGSVMLGDQTTI